MGAAQITPLRYSKTPKTSGLSRNIPRAYAVGAGVKRRIRSVVLNRPAETVTITDDFALNQPATSLQQTFMTVCAVTNSEPGKLLFSTATGHVQLNYDAARWQVSIDTVPTTAPEDASIPDKWGHKPIRRILLTATKPGTTGRFVYTFVNQPGK